MSKTKVIGYIRVSTDKQADEGVSLEAQEEKIRAYCAVYDLELIGLEVDAGKSAKEMTKRPGLQRALARVADGSCSALIVTKIDRLSRSLMDMGALVRDYFKNGDGLISIAEQINTGTATGRMFLNMITMFSQYEREIIAERTKDALDHLKDRGVQLGAAPLGMAHSDEEDEDGRRVLVSVPEQQAAIRCIRELSDGGVSLRGIAQRLNAQGYATKRGGRWHAQTVKLVLERHSRSESSAASSMS